MLEKNAVFGGGREQGEANPVISIECVIYSIRSVVRDGNGLKLGCHKWPGNSQCSSLGQLLDRQPPGDCA
jgi:hypothetical protein